MVSAGKATIAGPQAKPDAAKRQDARRPVKRPKLKASPTPATPAVDATFTSRAQPDASTQTVSRIASPEKKRQLRPHGPKHKEIAPPSEDGHAYSAKATCAAGLIKTTHNGSATPTASPASSLPPKFYAFGWDALPTLASVNEVCRDFLHGQCRFYERCTRIHPRGKNLSIFPTIPAGNNPPTANAGESISAEMVKDQHKGNLADVNSKAQQGDSPPAEASDVSRPSPAPQRKSSSLTDLAKSGIVLRYQPKRGMVPYASTPSADSSQTSDDSQWPSANTSPEGSSSSLIFEDDSKTKTPIARPPPPSRYFCRHWLMKQCSCRDYECQYVHGNLDYDAPVDGVYPGPQSQVLCKRWQEASCTRGYMCRYFHGDLDYLKPTGCFDRPNNLPAWEGVATSDAPEETEGKDGEDNAQYPPPESSAFCRLWMINRCLRGPSCSYFHGDVKYDPPVQGVHPPPRYPYTCNRWKLNDCFLGYSCCFVHEDLHYDDPAPSRHRPCNEGPTVQPDIKHLPPRFSETCQQWILNRCSQGYTCDYVHLDLNYDYPPPTPPLIPRIKEVPIDEPSNDNDPPIGQRPPPQSQDTCIQWLRDRCKARYACKYRHDDLEYDLPKPKPVDSLPMNNTTDNNATMEGRTWTVKVHDHAKIRIGPGFDIHDLETGFETPWLYLGNVPAHVTDKEVVDLLQPFGEIVDVKLPIQSNNPTMLVRARFTTPVGARDASTALHGAQVFGGKITARLPVHVRDASHNNATFTDTSVRIRWEAPSRTAYCGYSTMELAEAGMQVARKVFRDRYVHASVHIGLPVVGVVTIRFRGLPIDVNKEDMAWFAKPDDVVWAQPNYQKLDYAKSSIKRLLQQDLELLDFFVLPPPYKHAQVQAWAHFASPNDAKTACSRLHCRKPVFTGKTRIFVEHVQSLAFSVPSTTYGKIRSDIQALCQTVFSARRTSMSVVERPAPMATLVKLSGDDLKELGQLKVELEKILNWETIRQGASIAWDPFFAHPAGQSFLGHLERNTPNVTIHVDILRRMIRLLGSSKHRSTIREQILDKLTELQMRQIHTVPLDGWLLGQFMRSDLAQLQVQFGRENVDLDFHGRRLVVRGNETVYQGAKDAIHRARQVQLHPCRRQTTAVCPVCFDAVTKPVTLPCGHSWCRDCITHYLTSSINNKYFPLTCLGKNAKCTEYIPLQVARKILTIPEFDAVVDAAYAAYVQARSGEFHYCPTPDCPQIYRHAPRETVLQCPSCLLRICPSCHVEAHDGFSCPDPEGDTNLFRGWMKDHDVKPCPGCKVLIERAEGCNHMTCTQCKTHICWVCLKTFPGGNGIYDHMRAAHGGIGLAD